MIARPQVHEPSATANRVTSIRLSLSGTAHRRSWEPSANLSPTIGRGWKDARHDGEVQPRVVGHTTAHPPALGRYDGRLLPAPPHHWHASVDGSGLTLVVSDGAA